jgi:hypothetical protein
MSLENLKDAAFEEQDKERLVEFLNFITLKARFELDVKEAIKLRDFLAWMQSTVLVKMSKNIMGEVKVHEGVVDAPVQKKASSKKKASK